MMSALELGEKVHVVTRRLFESDLRRHFAGEVTRESGGLFEVQGYSFVYDLSTNKYHRAPELRTRIFPLTDAAFIVNKLPIEVEIASLRYQHVDDRLVVLDAHGFSLDIHEFGLKE